jgi:hypothetical protein
MFGLVPPLLEAAVSHSVPIVACKALCSLSRVPSIADRMLGIPNFLDHVLRIMETDINGISVYLSEILMNILNVPSSRRVMVTHPCMAPCLLTILIRFWCRARHNAALILLSLSRNKDDAAILLASHEVESFTVLLAMINSELDFAMSALSLKLLANFTRSRAISKSILKQNGLLSSILMIVRNDAGPFVAQEAMSNFFEILVNLTSHWIPNVFEPALLATTEALIRDSHLEASLSGYTILANICVTDDGAEAVLDSFRTVDKIILMLSTSNESVYVQVGCQVLFSLAHNPRLCERLSRQFPSILPALRAVVVRLNTQSWCPEAEAIVEIATLCLASLVLHATNVSRPSVSGVELSPSASPPLPANEHVSALLGLSLQTIHFLGDLVYTTAHSTIHWGAMFNPANVMFGLASLSAIHRKYRFDQFDPNNIVDNNLTSMPSLTNAWLMEQLVHSLKSQLSENRVHQSSWDQITTVNALHALDNLLHTFAGDARCQYSGFCRAFGPRFRASEVLEAMDLAMATLARSGHCAHNACAMCVDTKQVTQHIITFASQHSQGKCTGPFSRKRPCTTEVVKTASDSNTNNNKRLKPNEEHEIR